MTRLYFLLIVSTFLLLMTYLANKAFYEPKVAIDRFWPGTVCFHIIYKIHILKELPVLNPKTRNISKLALVFTLFFLLAGNLFSYNARSGAEFLNLEVSPRSAGMARSYVSRATDISSVNINPAAVAFVKAPELYYMHQSILSEFHTEYISTGLPLSLFIESSKGMNENLKWVQKLRVGFQMLYWHTADIDVIGNDTNAVVESVKVYDMFTGLSLGYNLLGNRIGANIKYVKRQLADYSTGTTAFDLGIMRGLQVPRFLPYPMRYNLTLGASVDNLGPGIDFAGLTEQLPTRFKLGASYGIYGDRDHLLDLSLGVSKPLLESFYLHTGIEYKVFRIFAFRTGLEYGTNDLNFTMGTGLRYTFRKVTYEGDYSYLPRRNGIPDAHTFSIMATLSFIEPAKKKRVTSLGILEGSEDEDTDDKAGSNMQENTNEDSMGKIKIQKKTPRGD